MSSRLSDRNILLVYATIFFVGVAYGAVIGVVPLYLDERLVPKTTIGWLATFFAGGLVAFSLPMGAIIKRFSARAVLIVSLLGYSVAVAVFPFMPGFVGWAGARFFDGAFSVGVWVSCETILLSRAKKEHKAFVTSLYAVSLALGYFVGAGLANRLVDRGITKNVEFVVAGVLTFFAALLIATRIDADTRSSHEIENANDPTGTSPYGVIFWKTKCSCFATFSYGYFQAAIVLFLPIYLIHEKHVAEGSTILATVVFALGMLVFSNLVGRIGDRFGHLAVIRVLGLIGTAMILGFVYLDTYWVMLVAVFVAGATIATISPVSLALQGLVTKPGDLARANAIYNAFYAVGMLIGPPITSVLFSMKGGGRLMLFHFAAMWLLFLVATVVFRRDDPRVNPAAAAS